MRRLPRADRAVAAVLDEALDEAGLSARQLAARMKRPHNYIARFVSMARLPTAGEFVAVSKALGKRPSVLMGRVERRLKAG